MSDNNNKELYGYVISSLVEDVDRLKSIVILGTDDKESLIIRVRALEEYKEDISKLEHTINNIYEKVIALQIEDKTSRSKIMILLIILALSYISSLVPKIAIVLENITKYI